MQNSVKQAKASLRARITDKVLAISPDARWSRSAAACDLLLSQEHWRQARTVLLFAPIRCELDIWPLVDHGRAAGKRLALPRFMASSETYAACELCDGLKDVVPGRYGIREPADHCLEIPLNRLDLLLVPGVAFDLRGGRIGRGKGYYDRLLTKTRGTTCGVAFDEQIVPTIPTEAHDVLLDCILTPTRWIRALR
jgi:5-formyltetrahydrofolate cyclo-ligase